MRPGWAASRAALEVAERSAAPEAMARAHCAAGIVEYYNEGSAALTHLQDAYAFASQVGDPLRMGFAAIYWTNYLQYQSRLADSVVLYRRLSEEVLAAGDPVISTFLAAAGAGLLLSLGDWDECRRLLRPALAAGRMTFGGATASTVMSLLSTRTGDLRQAQAHVDRMLELVDASWVGWPLDRPIVELHLARGDPRAALATLRERYERVEWRDQQGDLHTALGASAAADLAQQARDRQDAAAESEAQAALDEMLGYGVELARHPRAQIDDPVTDLSWSARLRAEVARCRRDSDEPEAWEAAMIVNQECGFPWDEALCGWRFGQVLLRGDGARSRANEPLRRAYALASGLGAAPLTREIHALARTVDLQPPGRGAPFGHCGPCCFGAQQAGARGPRVRRRWSDQCRDRPGAVHQREDGERPRLQHPSQDRYFEAESRPPAGDGGPASCAHLTRSDGPHVSGRIGRPVTPNKVYCQM